MGADDICVLRLNDLGTQVEGSLKPSVESPACMPVCPAFQDTMQAAACTPINRWPAQCAPCWAMSTFRSPASPTAALRSVERRRHRAGYTSGTGMPGALPSAAACALRPEFNAYLLKNHGDDLLWPRQRRHHVRGRCQRRGASSVPACMLSLRQRIEGASSRHRPAAIRNPGSAYASRAASRPSMRNEEMSLAEPAAASGSQYAISQWHDTGAHLSPPGRPAEAAGAADPAPEQDARGVELLRRQKCKPAPSELAEQAPHKSSRVACSTAWHSTIHSRSRPTVATAPTWSTWTETNTSTSCRPVARRCSARTTRPVRQKVHELLDHCSPVARPVPRIRNQAGAN